MNKITGLALVTIASLSIGTARAADMAIAPTKAAPSFAVATAYNWTGLYVGGNAGYGWGDQDPLVLFSNRFDRASFDISGGMIGGTIGAQIQQGYVVLGFEGDLDWANIKGTNTLTPSILGIGQGINLNVASTINAFGTLRARTGVALNNMLFYVTGGGAMVSSNAKGSSIAGVQCGTLGIIPACSGSSWRPGLTAGMGVEWGLTPNWSMKAEYLYTQVIGSGLNTNSFNTVRSGINYRF